MKKFHSEKDKSFKLFHTILFAVELLFSFLIRFQIFIFLNYFSQNLFDQFH